MSKVQAGPIQVPAGDANPHNNDLGKRKFQKSSTMSVLDLKIGPWGTNMSGTHSNKSDGLEIENLL